MRTLSGFLFFLGLLALYIGLGMFLMLESDQADYRFALLFDSGLVLIGELLLSASGWCWFRAKETDLRLFEPEKALAQSRRQIRASLSVHVLIFALAGSGLVLLVIVEILNRPG